MNDNRRRTLSGVGAFSAFMAGLINRWPLTVAFVFMISPIGPHAFLGGEYRQVFGNRTYVSCSYLGSRGVITVDHRYFDTTCPLINWLDSRAFQP